MHLTVFSIASAFCASIVAVHAFPQVTNVKLRDVAIAGYVDEGCYTEATNMRALSGLAYYNDQMTVEDCASACSNFLWFGVEYGRECYCGNTINPGSVSAPLTDCSFPCPGNAAETCGAGNRLNMYTKTSNAAAPPPPAAPPTTYASQGCYTEATNGRALTAKSTNVNSMTVEMCATTCVGYTYFGVEYHTECYCGNALMAGSVPAPPAECKYRCPGNSAESCGGDLRLNVYEFGGTPVAPPPPAVSTYKFVSCYTEASNMRALTGLAYFNDSLTTEQCAIACLGFTYFGTEYGRECYCGNSFNPGSVPADNSQCNFLCPGNSAELCGGQDRLDVYQYGPQTTSTTTSSSTSTTTSTSSSTSTTTSTSSSTGTCATPIVDGGFESATIPWYTGQDELLGVSVDFQVSSAITAPFSGSYSASITLPQGAGDTLGYIYQDITLCPNTLYSFSAWSKVLFEDYDNCVIFYDLYDYGTNDYVILGIGDTFLTGWVQTTGTYTSSSMVAKTLRIMPLCQSEYLPTSTFYFDEITLVAT